MGMLVWLESLPLSVWVHESPSVWAQPTVLTLHTMGMGVLVGASWVLDLRLLGINRNVPLSAFRCPTYRYSHTLSNDTSCCASIGFVM